MATATSGAALSGKPGKKGGDRYIEDLEHRLYADFNRQADGTMMEPLPETVCRYRYGAGAYCRGTATR